MAEDLELVEETAPPPFVRVVADGPTAKDARVELVDGDEVSPLPYVRKATFTLEAGSPNSADLELLVVHGDVAAPVVRLREIAVPPPPRPKLSVTITEPERRWFGLRRSRVLVRQLTPAGDGFTVDYLAFGWVRPSAHAYVEATVQETS